MRRRVVLALFALMAGAPPVLGRDPVTVVVPFPPGGGADFLARELARGMPPALGAPVLVENRGGEDGVTGVRYAAASAPDGRTLLLGSTASVVLAPQARGQPALDPLADFEPVALIATLPRVIVVHPSVPARNLDELIRLARSAPETLRCATSDALSRAAAEAFARAAAAPALRCPDYEGPVARLRDELASGRLTLGFESVLIDDAQRGRVRPLAVAAQSRLAVLPSVPTASEAGLPGFEAVAWLALLAPKDTPPSALADVEAAVLAALKRPDTVRALHIRGYLVHALGRAAARRFFERERVPAGSRARDGAPSATPR